jgi:hypothetical protein
MRLTQILASSKWWSKSTITCKYGMNSIKTFCICGTEKWLLRKKSM